MTKMYDPATESMTVEFVVEAATLNSLYTAAEEVLWSLIPEGERLGVSSVINTRFHISLDIEERNASGATLVRSWSADCHYTITLRTPS